MRTRLLIGSDGYFSRVRAQLLGDGPPPFTGNIMWRARLPQPAAMSTDRTRHALVALLTRWRCIEEG